MYPTKASQVSGPVHISPKREDAHPAHRFTHYLPIRREAQRLRGGRMSSAILAHIKFTAERPACSGDHAALGRKRLTKAFSAVGRHPFITPSAHLGQSGLRDDFFIRRCDDVYIHRSSSLARLPSRHCTVISLPWTGLLTVRTDDGV